MTAEKAMPLQGLKVLEMGQLLAGPFAGTILAAFGADVIKIEPPGVGDPLRRWRKVYKGTSLWWYILGRNKKCITVNLRHPKGQEIARRLAQQVDILVENFKPGTLEAWGLGWEQLHALNPRLIMVRVSGWGQTGPYAHRPGYASVAEAMGGLRYVTGYPDRPPVRPNLSLGDTLAGLHAALGALMAIYHRDVLGSRRGQMVDVAIYEAVFNMMESLLPEYDKLGYVREREGSKLSGIVPTNTYRCKDGKYIVIGGNGDTIFKRLMVAIGRKDLAEDPRLAHNDGRVEHEELIDRAIEAWTEAHTFQEVFETLEAAGVPCGPIYSIAEMVKDPHFLARGLFEEVTILEGERVKIPRILPFLSETPGYTKWVGPPLGPITRKSSKAFWD
ncbi:MAG: CaiB/BaiF CoA-transferase family protein [Acidobacteriota bacterium]|nr:CaiB/BaiF CoA-transferase family protein [Acidobacteriota bacterium]